MRQIQKGPFARSGDATPEGNKDNEAAIEWDKSPWEVLPMRLKRPPQPLVVRYAGATALCDGVAGLYERYPHLKASLCLYGGNYYLKAAVDLKARPQVRRTAEEYGTVLGACPVLYAFCEEHGRWLSADAVKELGGALWKQ